MKLRAKTDAGARAPGAAAPEPAPLPTPPPALGALLGIIDRVETVIDTETEALSRHLPFDMADANQRKRQGLLELSRILRALAGIPPHPEARDRLAGLSAKLERNRGLLEVKLRAVREVAEIIARSMKEADSDGTYCLLASRR